jgi:cation diffusion facilitator CzcD-associated flavoprotein CzcO
MQSLPSGTRQETSCPVVVVGGGSVAGLGVARSLSTARTSVMVLDTSRFNAALWSRHCSGRVVANLSGSAPTFGPVMRFMFGAKRATPMLARRIAAQSAGVAEAQAIGIKVSAAGSVGRR